MGMSGVTPAVLHSELLVPPCYPCPPLQSVRARGPPSLIQAPADLFPGVKIKSVASSPYPLGLPHHPTSGPLAFPANGPEVELSTQTFQASDLPLLAGHIEEGAFRRWFL